LAGKIGYEPRDETTWAVEVTFEVGQATAIDEGAIPGP